MSLESFIPRPGDYSLKLFPMKLYGESENIFLNTALSFSPRWLRFFSPQSAVAALACAYDS